jgi:hypothetical protein
MNCSFAEQLSLELSDFLLVVNILATSCSTRRSCAFSLCSARYYAFLFLDRHWRLICLQTFPLQLL